MPPEKLPVFGQLAVLFIFPGITGMPIVLVAHKWSAHNEFAQSTHKPVYVIVVRHG